MSTRHIFALSLLAWLASGILPLSAAESAAYMDGPVTLWPFEAGGNGHFYQAVSVPGGLSWREADAAARRHGGYLATLTTAEENQFVFRLVDDPKYWSKPTPRYSHGPWLGGIQSDGAGEPRDGWLWINEDGPILNLAWASGQPDNVGDENRLNFFSWTGGKREALWNDEEHTDLMQGFVIEFDKEPVPASNIPTLAWVVAGTFLLLTALLMGWRMMQANRRPSLADTHD